MSEPMQAFNSILVIDDNEAIHQDFGKIFASSPNSSELDELAAELFGDEHQAKSAIETFDLQFASQGREGLDLLKSNWARGHRFGLAFVDMRMPPGWDGVETIEQLWKVDPDLQVVICTAYSDRSWDEIFERLGSTDRLLILKKPFDSIEVVQLATSLTEKRRLMESARNREEDLKSVVQTQKTELIEAHKDAEILIDSMSNALVSLDEYGAVSRWNSVASQLFGIEVDDALERPFKSLPIKWESWSQLATALRECGRREKRQLTIRFTDYSDSVRTLNVTICPIICDLTTKARLFLATDITKQKAMQSQLDQALRLESVGQLAAGVAHEINTPMQYIGDNVRFVSKALGKLDGIMQIIPSLVDGEVSDTEIIEFRKQFVDSFKPKKLKSSLAQIPDALQDSIDGVMTVSKIVAAMKEFSHPGNEEKSKVCVNHILESTITVAKNEWKYVASIDTDFQENVAKIDGLPSELNQAFLNIIVNAAHAIGSRVEAGEMEKGAIKIATRTVGDKVEITFTDDGGGIPPNVQEKVFEPFFTTKEIGKGTGQGLAIAYAVVVQKHGGHISFSVNEGVGTTFSIQLPQNENGEKKLDSRQELTGAQQ